MAWEEKGKCKDMSQMFLPDPELPRSIQVHRTAAAKTVCVDCPVKDECLEYALQHREPGVWGGTDDAERRAIRRYLRALELEANPPKINKNRKIVHRPRDWST